MTENDRLMELAEEARKNAYVPYSDFRVGAALLAADGTIYTGCNIENAAYSPGNCAERTAIFKAVSEGQRDFVKIAVVGGKSGETADFTAPCGMCRQVIAEFCGPDFIFLLGKPGEYREYRFSEILPYAFTPKNLGK